MTLSLLASESEAKIEKNRPRKQAQRKTLGIEEKQC